MNCDREGATHHLACDCREAAMSAEIARLTRERDEARERAESLSRELLAAIRARDSYRASAELRVGLRREFEALLGCGDTTGEEAFERGLIRLRGLLAAEKELAEFSEILSRHNHEWSERCELAESRAEQLEKALRRIADYPCDWQSWGRGERTSEPPEPCAHCIARAALREEGK